MKICLRKKGKLKKDYLKIRNLYLILLIFPSILLILKPESISEKKIFFSLQSGTQTKVLTLRQDATWRLYGFHAFCSSTLDNNTLVSLLLTIKQRSRRRWRSSTRLRLDTTRRLYTRNGTTQHAYLFLFPPFLFLSGLFDCFSLALRS